MLSAFSRPVQDSTPARFEGVPTAICSPSSNPLLLGEHEIGIEHRGALYRLKTARQGS
ncbi:hemin uptake protein HemP [Mesorhizobium sp. AaZ16]|uniref:hemin uptake protein HemP n=1 Tax=Mesorhizobium sp. AaZ16 TaxID=3402289 RepID=UPI00374E75C5